MSWHLGYCQIDLSCWLVAIFLIELNPNTYYEPTQYSLLTIGALLHVVSLYSFVAFYQDHFTAIIIGCLLSSLAASWIYQIVIENKWKLSTSKAFISLWIMC